MMVGIVVDLMLTLPIVVSVNAVMIVDVMVIMEQRQQLLHMVINRSTYLNDFDIN